MGFSKISSIIPEQENTWREQIFLTVDTDWASDEVISFLVDILEKSNVAATFFATNDTPVLKRIIESPLFELGIHPNFDFLLDGTAQAGTSVKTVLDNCLEFAPNATSVRSHCLTQGSKITTIFEANNLTHECNMLIPFTHATELKPWYHCGDKSIRIPHFWEDGIHAAYGWDWNIKPEEHTSGLNVFAFHPNHVYLNMDDLSLYEKSRPLHKDPQGLREIANNTNMGTRDFLHALLARHS